MIRYTEDHWSFGIKQGDNEIIVAGGVPIAEVIPTDCTTEEFQGNCILILNAALMFEVLEELAMCDADPEIARRKGYDKEAKEKRDALLLKLGSNAFLSAKARRMA
jgi:hypothetical protein